MNTKDWEGIGKELGGNLSGIGRGLERSLDGIGKEFGGNWKGV